MPHGADRLSLLPRVAARLRERRIPFAVIGAAAMAVHGVSRSASIRRGDAADPLAGAVRLTGPGQAMLDIIVGRSAWQARVLERASASKIEGISVPVATAADLILLKLYAGGPQDAWDVERLLVGPGRAALVAEVAAMLGTLPEDSRRLWARIVGPR